MSVAKEEETSRNNLNRNWSTSAVETTTSVHLQSSAKFPQTPEESTRVPESSEL